MSAKTGTTASCPSWHCEGRRGLPLSGNRGSWTPTPWPGWNRQCAGLSAPYAARCAIIGAAAWHFPSILRRLMLSAQTVHDRGSKDPPATGRGTAGVPGPMAAPAACAKPTTRDANRTSCPRHTRSRRCARSGLQSASVSRLNQALCGRAEVCLMLAGTGCPVWICERALVILLQRWSTSGTRR